MSCAGAFPTSNSPSSAAKPAKFPAAATRLIATSLVADGGSCCLRCHHQVAGHQRLPARVAGGPAQRHAIHLGNGLVVCRVSASARDCRHRNQGQAHQCPDRAPAARIGSAHGTGRQHRYAEVELVDAPMQPEWWVIELSSFQTRQMQCVELAVITNIEETPRPALAAASGMLPISWRWRMSRVSCW